MTDGRLHAYGGKLLAVGGKLAAADACCCDSIEYGDDCGYFDAGETPLYHTVTFTDGSMVMCSGASACEEDIRDYLEDNGPFLLTQLAAPSSCTWSWSLTNTGNVFSANCSTATVIGIDLLTLAGTWFLFAKIDGDANEIYSDTAANYAAGTSADNDGCLAGNATEDGTATFEAGDLT